MFGIIAALLSGALMSIQGVFNTEVTKQTGTCLLYTSYRLCIFKNAPAFLLRDARHAMHDKKMTTKSETNDKDAENKEKG